MAQGKYFFSSHAQHTTAILGALDVIFSIVSMMTIICLESLANAILLSATGSSAPKALVDFFSAVSNASGGTGLLHGFLIVNLASNVGLLFGVLRPFRFLMLPWMILKSIGCVPFAITVISVFFILPTASSMIFGGGAILLSFSVYIYQLVVACNAFSELRPGNMQQRQDNMI